MAQAAGPLLTQLLERFGLSSLTSWAAELIIQGVSEDELVLRLYDQGPFKQRFPAIEARERAGLAPINPEEYLAYENAARQAAKAYGINITQEQINKNLAQDVSIRELTEDRMAIAAQVVFRTDAFTRQELERLYGLTTGDMMEYAMDPTVKLPELQRRFVTANISGEARRTGFDAPLRESQLDYLMNRGITGETAAEAFGALVQAEELFEAVDETEQDIGIDDQLRLITGDVEQAQKVERRGERRAARFAEGGGFASGQEGLAGLGSANR